MDSVLVGRSLIPRLMSALLQAHDKAVAPLGITSREGAALLFCARREANTPVQLAFLVGLDVSSMSRMLDRLEKRHLLVRSRSRIDRRTVVVGLTPKGRVLLNKALPPAARVAQQAWRNVTEQERKTLRRIVHKILGNLGHVQGNL